MQLNQFTMVLCSEADCRGRAVLAGRWCLFRETMFSACYTTPAGLQSSSCLSVPTVSVVHAWPFACRVCWIRHRLCSRVVIRGSYKSLASRGKTNGKLTSMLRRWLCAQQWDGLKHILHIPGWGRWMGDEYSYASLIPLLLRLWSLCFV